MDIRLATPNDEEALKKIYAKAREYMVKDGNPTQWGSNHPPFSLIQKDIQKGCLYILEEKGEVHACFAIQSFDPCYEDKNTEWRYHDSYLVIHSLASDGMIKHVFDIVIDFVLTKTNYIRIDTYKDNKTMLSHLSSRLFLPAGYCFQPDGTTRLCFELKDNR
jgi:hypothetical protein